MFNTPEEIFYSVIAGVLLMIFIGLIFILSIVRYQNRLHKHQQEKLKLQEDFSTTLLQSQLEIQEQTFQHISRELHDNLGQVASLIKINLTTLKLDDAAKASEKIEDTKELTRQLIGDIKSLSVSMNSDRITQSGLAKALEMEVGRLNKTGLFNAYYKQTGIVPVIKNDTTMILYRMVQEILNNMVKHSEAKSICVNLTVSESLFILALSDDGKGFNMDEQLKSGGSGLQNLQKRAALINAKLYMQSSPGNGTSVSVELPL